VITANGLRTDPLHMYYKKNFVSAMRLSMQRVFTTDKGALTEVPYIDMDKVIKYQGKKAPDIPPDLREKNYERYLAKINCFVINFEHGNSFVEVENPLNDLYSFMLQKNKEYKCQACNASMTANDDKPHKGDSCPTCKNKALIQANPCDIEKNMARIKSLVSFVGGN
jgi:DNA-directed RNA polymerase subunit RPC12/RpoP